MNIGSNELHNIDIHDIFIELTMTQIWKDKLPSCL
jgi:hypothetical protein